MAAGKLGSAALEPNVYTTVYTAPAEGINSVAANINVVNRDAVATAKVRLALGVNSTPLPADFLEYDAQVPTGGILERSALVLSPGEKVIAYTDGANITVRVHGYEEQ
jgi:hypothetical protein